MGDVEVIIKPHMLCYICRVKKIARLELIWCKDCAPEKEKEKDG